MLKKIVSLFVMICIVTAVAAPACFAATSGTVRLKSGYAVVLDLNVSENFFEPYYEVKLGYNDGTEGVFRLQKKLTLNGNVVDTSVAEVPIYGEYIFYRLSDNDEIYYIEYDPAEPMYYSGMRYNASTRCFTGCGITVKRDEKPLFQSFNDWTVGQAFPDGNHEYSLEIDKYHVSIIHADSGMDATLLGMKIMAETYGPGSQGIWIDGEIDYETSYRDMEICIEVSDTEGRFKEYAYGGIGRKTFWGGIDVPWDGTSYNIRMWVEGGGSRMSPIYSRRCTMTKFEAVRGVITAVSVNDSAFKPNAQFKILMDNGVEKIYSTGPRYIGNSYCEIASDFQNALVVGKWAVFMVGSEGIVNDIGIYDTKPYLIKVWRDSNTVWSSTYMEYGEKFYGDEWEDKDGWSFMGWYGNPQGRGTPIMDGYGNSSFKVTGDMNLYMIYKFGDSFNWHEDTFNFSSYSYFWGNKYHISDEHFNKLTEWLSSREKSKLKKKRNESFDGSAYGMSAVMALFSGGSDLNKIQKGAKSLSQLSYPKNNSNVASFINTYNLSQFLPDVQDEIDRQSFMGTKYIGDDIVIDYMQNENTNCPYVLIYEYKLGKKWYQNSVVVIKCEEYEFGYKLHIADPNMIVRSDPFASEYIPVKDSSPTYMYVDGPPVNDVIYKDANGEYSYSDGTLKLKAAFIEGWEYSDIGLMESSEDDKTTLAVNFDIFDIEGESSSASITEEGKTGEFDISEGRVYGLGTLTEYTVPAENTYTITANQDIEGDYAAQMSFKGDQSLDIYSTSKEKAQFSFNKSGAGSIVSENAADKNISILVESEEGYLGEANISAQVKELSFEYLGDSEYYISASESLKGAVLSVTDSYDRVAEIEISDEVEEFYFTCTADDDDMPCITLSGTNDGQTFVGNCTVVFCTDGGSEVETLTDVVAGSLIEEPAIPEKEGFIFDGWVLYEWDEEKWDFENNPVSESISLHAVWEPDPEYNKTFAVEVDGEIVQEVFRGEYVVSLSQYSEMFSDKATIIKGWSSVENSDVAEYAPDAEIVVTENTVLYPVVEREFVIEAKAEEFNSECYVNVNIYNPLGYEKVFVAGYIGNKMTGCHSFDGDDRWADVRFEIVPDTIKVMVWDKNNMAPIVKTINVTKSEEIQNPA